MNNSFCGDEAMAIIPSKQLHRTGTTEELQEYLSDREIGYSLTDYRAYIKIDGHLKSISISGGIIDAPNDNQAYLRKGGEWVTIHDMESWTNEQELARSELITEDINGSNPSNHHTQKTKVTDIVKVGLKYSEMELTSDLSEEQVVLKNGKMTTPQDIASMSIQSRSFVPMEASWTTPWKLPGFIMHDLGPNRIFYHFFSLQAPSRMVLKKGDKVELVLNGSPYMDSSHPISLALARIIECKSNWQLKVVSKGITPRFINGVRYSLHGGYADHPIVFEFANNEEFDAGDVLCVVMGYLGSGSGTTFTAFVTPTSGYIEPGTPFTYISPHLAATGEADETLIDANGEFKPGTVFTISYTSAQDGTHLNIEGRDPMKALYINGDTLDLLDTYSYGTNQIYLMPIQ